MTKTQFFTNITKPFKTRKEKIIAILRARGFLIYKTNKGDYKLEKNSQNYDHEYLNLILKKYHIGKVKPVIGSITKQRSYKVIINDDAKVKDAIDCFCNAEVYGCESCYMFIEWDQFVWDQDRKEIEIELLEPFIAYYVKAINKCGIHTECSCDGNHLDRYRNILEVYYNNCSVGLHQALWDELISKQFNIQMDEHLNIEITKSNRYEVYYKIFQIADFIYKHSKDLMEIKRIAIRKTIEMNRNNSKMTNDEKLLYCYNCYREMIIKYREELVNGDARLYMFD